VIRVGGSSEVEGYQPKGIDGLIAALNRKADILTATTAKAS
jgi:hypothetical protein